MGLIHVLDEGISNKIAAGEVVERPASVVKEMVENSIDAGASSITVEIKDGGISYIRVTDDGSGMDMDDAKLSFIRHATSKIYHEDDLSSIKTLGFRGEALASIASVSMVEMITKIADNTYGTKILIEGGEYKFIGSTGCADGTSIIVRNLFYNTPARLKFLKKEAREGAIVSDIVLKLALSKPDISFKFIKDGKLVFTTPGDGVLKNTIISLYGREVYDSLIEVSYKGNILSVHGFIGKPEIGRANRSFQTFFINNRYIKDRSLSAALENAYKTYLTTNKFPFCILYISIYPEMVDVNVHPTKAEVRFQDEREVFSSIFNTVRNGLAGEVLIPNVQERDNRYNSIKVEQQMFKYNNDFEVRESQGIRENIREVTNPINEPYAKKENKTFVSVEEINIDSEEKEAAEREDVKNLLPPLVVIGQCLGTYILAQGPDALYIIDQHAAHERVLYEKYKNTFETGIVQSQSLTVPIIVELTAREEAIIKENTNIISKLGFDFEYFGNNSVMIRSVPVIFGEPQLKKFFIEIVDLLDTNEPSNKSTIDNILYNMACKSAVKANDRLNNKEMEELINDLRKTYNPYTCPHGRPTIIKLTEKELEKKFKRIQ